MYNKVNLYPVTRAEIKTNSITDNVGAIASTGVFTFACLRFATEASKQPSGSSRSTSIGVAGERGGGDAGGLLQLQTGCNGTIEAAAEKHE